MNEATFEHIEPDDDGVSIITRSTHPSNTEGYTDEASLSWDDAKRLHAELGKAIELHNKL